MPISLETTPVTPNAVYTPQILIQTSAIGGKLKTSATLFLSGANVANAGTETETWTAAGQNGMISIDDIDNLDSDLSGLQSTVATLYAETVSLIGQINTIRKVL